MYAVLKSDLNTLRVELPERYVNTHDGAAANIFHPAQCKCPLNPVNPLLLRGKTKAWSEYDAVPLRPAEIQLKEQVLGAKWSTKLTAKTTLTRIKREKNIYWWSAPYQSKIQDCGCGGAEEEEVNLGGSLHYVSFDVNSCLNTTIHRCF